MHAWLHRWLDERYGIPPWVTTLAAGYLLGLALPGVVVQASDLGASSAALATLAFWGLIGVPSVIIVSMAFHEENHLPFLGGFCAAAAGIGQFTLIAVSAEWPWRLAPTLAIVLFVGAAVAIARALRRDPPEPDIPGVGDDHSAAWSEPQ